jgi:hypothetical protein
LRDHAPLLVDVLGGSWSGCVGFVDQGEVKEFGVKGSDISVPVGLCFMENRDVFLSGDKKFQIDRIESKDDLHVIHGKAYKGKKYPLFRVAKIIGEHEELKP